MATILFHCPQMADLAERIKRQDLDIELGQIDWNGFEDGWPNLYIHKVDDIREKQVAILISLDTPADVFIKFSAVYALTRTGAERLKIILPYFPTGTMERIEDEGEVATAMTLARAIGATPKLERGLASLVVYDIHSLQTRDSFSNSNVVPRFKTGIKYLKKAVEGRDISVAFPDYGAFRRFRKMFSGPKADRQFPIIICDKVRGDGGERTVTVREGDVKGRDIVIVDDIIKSGGTIIKAKDALRDAGATCVSAYATHGVFPQQSWKKFVNAGFDRVWITDSCPLIAKEIAGQAPFEVLSLDASIARVIAR